MCGGACVWSTIFVWEKLAFIQKGMLDSGVPKQLQKRRGLVTKVGYKLGILHIFVGYRITFDAFGIRTNGK